MVENKENKGNSTSLNMDGYSCNSVDILSIRELIGGGKSKAANSPCGSRGPSRIIAVIVQRTLLRVPCG